MRPYSTRLVAGSSVSQVISAPVEERGDRQVRDHGRVEVPSEDRGHGPVAGHDQVDRVLGAGHVSLPLDEGRAEVGDGRQADHLRAQVVGLVRADLHGAAAGARSRRDHGVRTGTGEGAVLGQDRVRADLEEVDRGLVGRSVAAAGVARVDADLIRREHEGEARDRVPGRSVRGPLRGPQIAAAGHAQVDPAAVSAQAEVGHGRRRAAGRATHERVQRATVVIDVEADPLVRVLDHEQALLLDRQARRGREAGAELGVAAGVGLLRARGQHAAKGLVVRATGHAQAQPGVVGPDTRGALRTASEGIDEGPGATETGAIVEVVRRHADVVVDHRQHVHGR